MTRFITIGEVETAYDDSGGGNPPLLLLHGLQGGRRMLDRLAEQLMPSLRVIGYDQRDSGETRSPPTPYDLEQLAHDAAALLRALGLERVHVFGTSFGGRIAQALALAHPALVDKLVLCSTWPVPKSLPEVNPEGIARFMRIRSALPASADELAEMFVPASYLRAHPEVRQMLVAMADAPERAARRAQAAGTTFGDASVIEAETLLIAGELDAMVPAHVTLGMAASIERSTGATLAGVGHASSLQAPDRLAELVKHFIVG